ncbi:hypothetical protein TanjilG_29938 [Lupinus angustifolius]|uniref:Uncharacterized protein n=1 Tax=Lupinus angustifolius TaxID=3871 RepID=A0A1J7HXK8_LUPAN|nr:hypothetical protein TanjilG_29938 [Lupinus angustifolius]
MEGTLGVRKGAWSNFEDDLLKACVQQYGEGKWHLVPKRAGLNRCRKSCRLRWSLIAGRLPERTPNDVKNYWNSNIKKKLSSNKEDVNARPKEIVMEPHIVIKPQPRTISRTSPLLRGKVIKEDESENKQCNVSSETCAAASLECNINWLGTLLEENGSFIENDTCLLGEQDATPLEDLSWDKEHFSLTTTEIEDFLKEDQSWSDVIDFKW